MASDDENTLRFISVDESKEENLLRASEASKEYDLNSEWISASDLENIDLETQRSVYVLENFEGESFEYLKKSKCRIVGPQCILSCLQTQTPLPNVQYPVYGVAMLGTAISCTSVPRQERDRLYDLIHLMGGIVMKDFTSAVTHLVAGEVGSKKYKVACSFNKPILLPQWVYKCWELSQDKHVCATDEQFMEFKCPTFKGITLCVTGIDAEKRKEIKKLVTQHGGTYSGALDMNTCTHLLVDEPRGEKYEYARRWNLHCVCTQWFYDSVQTGLCQDESSYYTQPNEENNSSQAGARFSGLIKGNTSKSSTEKKISNKAAQAAYKSAQKHGNKDLISGCGRYSRLSNQSKTDVSRIGETHISDPDGSDFDVRIQPGNMFLDGCKIYLSGFSGQNLEKLRKIINSGGGTRFNQINEIVSHVIVGNRIDADIDLLRNCDFQVFIVSVQWILDSAREGKKLSEEKYLCSDLLQREDLPLSCKENEDPAKTLSKATKNVSVLQPSASEKNKKDAKAKPKEDQCDGDDDYDDVFIQYLPQNEDQGSEPGQNLPQTDTTAQLKECSSFSADPDATLDNEEEEEAPQDGLLSGKFFTVAGFSSEHLTHLWQLLESNGGKAVSGGQTADYAVLPMNKVPEEDLQAKQLVTFCWLEQSLACDHLLAPEDGFLFKPFSIPEARKPLSGCVLTISQFTGVERDHIYQLAELLGAHCQEYFVRKASGNFKASTHLLCQDPDGNKYKAAMKWNIPVVSRDWLFACAAGGTLVPTNEYPVGSDKKVVVDANVCPSEELRVGKADAKDTSQDHILKSEEGELPIETNNEVSALHVQNVNNGGGDQGSTEKQPVKRPSMYFRPFRPSFDLADVMEELASPVCSSLRGRKSRGSRNSFPLGDFFAENIKQTLKKLGTVAPRTRKGDEENDDDETFDDIQQEREENGEPHQQGILVGVILSVSKKLAQQQTEIFNLASSLGADYRRLYDGSCTHLIHQGPSNDKSKEYAQAKARGIHIVSPHWLYSCQEKNERVDETMYPHTFNPKLSLSVVTTGRRMTRSSQAATTEQEMSPQKKRKSLSVKVNESSETKKLSKMGSVPEELAGEEKAEEGDIAEEVQQDPQMGPATLESLEAREDFKRQLEAIMDATKGKGRRRSRRHTSSSNSISVSHNSTGNVTSEMSLATRRTSSRVRSRVGAKANEGDNSNSSSRVKSRLSATDDSEHSQSDTITYDDPAGRMEREKIMAQLKRGCSPSPDTHTEDEEDDRPCNNTNTDAQTLASKESTVTGVTHTDANDTAERHVRELNVTVKSDPPTPVTSSTPAAPPIGLQIKDTHKPQPVNLLDTTALDQTQPRALTTPKFQLSVMTPQEKIDYSALIEQLGGQVFDTVYFNPECTHVVVGKPNRNEKYLAAVAAGKWVLHKSFLEASREAGYFIDESPHEWGQEIPGEPHNKLAAAPRRWRVKLRQERAAASEAGKSAASCGAFNSWVVLLCVDKSRQPGFKRLLESGGAKVSGCRPPFKNTSDFTHAFVDLAKTKVDSSDLNTLQRDNVWCLKPDYIAEYLMQEPPPPPQKYLLSELGTPGEQDRSIPGQTRKRKGEDLTGGDKRVRV